MPFIGVDYGGRRIGVAISESGVLASPHSVIANDRETLTKLETLAREIGAETFVVGIARRTHSQAGEGKFRDFAEGLRQKTCKSVQLWDETLSTVEANERLRASGRRSAKHDLDMYAAAVILQSYLDALARRTP